MTPPSKWLFFPAPAATGPLQTITWTMTGADTATVSSSGAAIINPVKTNLLAWNDGVPRLWNGSAATSAANYDTFSSGRYFFTSRHDVSGLVVPLRRHRYAQRRIAS